MRVRFPSAIFLLWIAGVSVAADAPATPLSPAPPTALRILAVEEPPTAFLGADGRVEGVAVDAVREIGRRLGIDIAIEVVPEQRALAIAAHEPNVVLLGFSRTPSRETSYHWITPLIRKPWVLYLRPGDQRRINTLGDLRALSSIGVVRGDVRHLWLQAQGLTNLTETGAPEQAMAMLLGGRVDAVFHEPQGVAWFCQERGCGRARPVPAWTGAYSEVWILMSKAGTGPALAQRWQAAATAMRADGTWERIARRWLGQGRDRFGMQALWRHGLLEFCVSEAGCGAARPVPK